MEPIIVGLFVAFLGWYEGRSQGEVPEDCPGVGSENAGKESSCAGCPNQQACASGEAQAVNPVLKIIEENMTNIKKVILVISGKGGVGKSTIASQLAFKLSKNHSVGLLDVDICGPSIPRMTKTSTSEVLRSADGWVPIMVTPNLCVLSIGHMLDESDAAVIWRGPKKNALISKFLSSVAWGDLDYLIIDTPPGTSDEHLSLVSYLPKDNLKGALVVTTPEMVSIEAVKREINFCKTVEIPIIGVIENMANSVFDSVSKSRVRDMCAAYSLRYCQSVALTKELIASVEAGEDCPKLDMHDTLNLLDAL